MRKETKYTKKQILEAIDYWKDQLKNKNYKKINESASAEDLEQAVYDLATMIQAILDGRLNLQTKKDFIKTNLVKILEKVGMSEDI